MRLKITFQLQTGSYNTVPLHHQKIVSNFLQHINGELQKLPFSFNFSSLKGTTKVQNGMMKFLSNKLSLVVGSADEDYMQLLRQYLETGNLLNLGKMQVKCKNISEIPDAGFNTQMRYVCISPIILYDVEKQPELALEAIEPMSKEFSDQLYNSTMDRMEAAGYSTLELSQFAEFEVLPDPEYINKSIGSTKKYVRTYKSNTDKQMSGYLLPFTLHAHPKVHEFFWNSGIGELSDQGYGMIDVAKEELKPQQSFTLEMPDFNF